LTFFFSDRNVFGTHPAHISSFWDCFPLCIRDSNVKLAVRRYLFLELRICWTLPFTCQCSHSL